jgi:hypothetical protein
LAGAVTEAGGRRRIAAPVRATMLRYLAAVKPVSRKLLGCWRAITIFLATAKLAACTALRLAQAPCVRETPQS